MFGVLRNASDIDLSKNRLLVTDWHCKDGFVLYDRSSKLDMIYVFTRGSYKGSTKTYCLKLAWELLVKYFK